MKVDSPENYHTHLTAHKVFETKYVYGYGFLVELECNHTLEFADTTLEEVFFQKIRCPSCRKYKEIMRYRRVKIE